MGTVVQYSAMPVRTVIERGPKGKRSVAFALDWPGWSRGATSAEVAQETLESYRERYRPVADLAGMAREFDAAGSLEVVEDRVGKHPYTASLCASLVFALSFVNGGAEPDPFERIAATDLTALVAVLSAGFEVLPAKMSCSCLRLRLFTPADGFVTTANPTTATR